MLELNGVSKRYGDVIALRPTDLLLADSSVTALIGPSGCGKSTLLRVMNGLVVPDSGSVALAGQPVTPDTAIELRRRMGMVIQDGGLFPHLTAFENVSLLATWMRLDRDWVRARVDEMVSLTQFPASALRRFPAELSGGQAQRVALMRALMLEPEVLLLDEPMAALDPLIRADLQNELGHIFGALRCTVVLVTHDLDEAVALAGRIVLMRDGGIVQDGSPRDLLERPAEPFVTRFVRAQHSPVAELTP